MIIYHGSKAIIENPLFKGSNPSNDYGPAFYLTTDLNSAKSWARKNDELGVVNKYYVDNETFQSLKVLDLTDKNIYSVLNWMAILMHFRELSASFKKIHTNILDWLSKYYINVDDYDVIIGYRADDSYFRFPISFIDNRLSFEDLETAYRSGNLGIQFAFISKRAIKALKFESVIECENTFIGQYHSTVSKASEEVKELLSAPKDANKTYIFDLMRKDNG